MYEPLSILQLNPHKVRKRCYYLRWGNRNIWQRLNGTQWEEGRCWIFLGILASQSGTSLPSHSANGGYPVFYMGLLHGQRQVRNGRAWLNDCDIWTGKQWISCHLWGLRKQSSNKYCDRARLQDLFWSNVLVYRSICPPITMFSWLLKCQTFPFSLAVMH